MSARRMFDEPIAREDTTPPNGNGHDSPHSGLADLSDRQLLEQATIASAMAQDLAGKAARAGEQAFQKASNAWSSIKDLEKGQRRIEAQIGRLEVGVLEAIGRVYHEEHARTELEAQVEDAKRRLDEKIQRAEVTGQHNLRELQLSMRERESSQREEFLTEAARAQVAVAHAAEALAKQRAERLPSDPSDIGKKLANIVVLEKEADLARHNEWRKVAIKVAEVAAVSLVSIVITWIFTHH